jgi:methanogenic corrinoid protein MtbC1
MTNHINPAQEHLVTNIIRQKLIVGIESASSHFQSNSVVLLFLPEGEHHEMGLLFIHYLLKSRGVRVWYLGSNVPLKDLEYVVNIKKPDFVYSHLTSMANNFNVERFLSALSIKIPTQKVIISGQITQQYKKKPPVNIQFKSSLSEVMEFAATL